VGKNEEVILLSLNLESLCDDCLAHQCGIQPRQTVNIICRRKAVEGVVLRSKSRCTVCGGFKIVNQLRETPGQPPENPYLFLHHKNTPCIPGIGKAMSSPAWLPGSNLRGTPSCSLPTPPAASRESTWSCGSLREASCW
jgi:hypothetical protein